MSKFRYRAVVLCAVGVTLAGCGSSSSTAPASTLAASTSLAAGSASGIAADGPSSADLDDGATNTGQAGTGDDVGPQTGSGIVGQTISLYDGRWATQVSVVKVTDPARAAAPPNMVPEDGDRFVGVEFHRADTAPASVIADGDQIARPASELTLVTANGQTFHGLSDGTVGPTLAGCTPVGDLPDPQLDSQPLEPGEKVVDCVVFQVPIKAQFVKITYEDEDRNGRPGTSPNGAVATWTLAHG